MTESKSRAEMARKITAGLQELPGWFELLELFRDPGSRPADPTGRHSSSDPARSPVDLDVLDLLDGREKPGAHPTREDYGLDRVDHQWRDFRNRLTGSAAARRTGILPTVVAWVRRVESELLDAGETVEDPWARPCSGFVVVDGPLAGVTSCSGLLGDRHHTRPMSVERAAGWLLGRLAWILDAEWAAAFVEDLEQMLTDIKAIAGEKHSAPAPLVCINPGCGWPVEEHSDGAWFTCRGCETSFSRVELWRRAEHRRPQPLSVCAERAGVTLRTLQNYRADGRIKRVAREGGRDLYDVDEVMRATLELRYRSSTRGQGGKFEKRP